MLKQGPHTYFNPLSFSSIRISCPHLNSQAIVAAILFCERSYPTLNRNNNFLFSLKSNLRSPNTDQFEHGLLFLHLKSFTGKFMRRTFIYYETVAIFFNYILFTFKAYIT